MISILIIEDDQTIANGVATFLKQHHFQIDVAHTLKDAATFLSEHTYHIILIDIMLPDGNGLEFYKQMAPVGKVVFLSAIEEEHIIIDTLEQGVEDYIIKPFRLPILLARIQAIIKRNNLSMDTIEPFHHLHVNVTKQIVLQNDEPLNFTANELKLFFYLYQHKNQILSREQLLNFLWDSKGNFVNDNTLSVTLKRLRQKIECSEPIIITFRGVGYQMKG